MRSDQLREITTLARGFVALVRKHPERPSLPDVADEHERAVFEAYKQLVAAIFNVEQGTISISLQIRLGMLVERWRWRIELTGEPDESELLAPRVYASWRNARPPGGRYWKTLHEIDYVLHCIDQDIDRIDRTIASQFGPDE